MKKMPRVVTFLQLMSQAGSHTTYPSEQEEKAAKRQSPVSHIFAYLYSDFDRLECLRALGIKSYLSLTEVTLKLCSSI